MSPHDCGGDDGRDGDGDGDGDELLFAGVRFALAGFDPVTESQVRPPLLLSLAARLSTRFRPLSFRFGPVSLGESSAFGSTGRIWWSAAAPTRAGAARRGAPTWSSSASST
jgi:hypothetical protein